MFEPNSRSDPKQSLALKSGEIAQKIRGDFVGGDVGGRFVGSVSEGKRRQNRPQSLAKRH